jgi:WD40 repeat protein
MMCRLGGFVKNIFACALTLFGISFLSACGSITPPAATVAISTSASSITIPQSTTLNWSSTNATSCAASSNPSQPDWAGTVPTGGTRTVAPTTTGIVTYALSCTGPGGGTSGTTTVTVNPSDAPKIISAAPSYGVLNVPYDFQFAASLGVQPLTWMETGPLPAGLNFSPQGELSGTPTASGPFQITVDVQDADGQTAAPESLTINILLHGFQATGDMGTAREYHTATLLNNGKVLVTGGYDGTNVLGSAEIFDPLTGIFTPTAGPMTTTRRFHTATLLANGPAATNGKVLIAGGDSTQTAELFDPATGTFTATTGALTRPRLLSTATLLKNGKVLIAGGFGNSTAELFDPATGTFSVTGSMSADRDSATATLLNNGMVLIAGGEDYGGDALISAEVYDPTSGIFTATDGLMTNFRTAPTGTLLSSGKVLIAGGYGEGPALATAELFDPATVRFSLTGLLETPRAYHTATLLNDGTVLVAGGSSDNSAEIYNATTATFTLTAAMTTTRSNHTATLLNNGHVLLIGGIDNSGVVLKSAESYNF